MRDVHANIVTIIAYRRTQNFSHLALLRLLVHQKCARSGKLGSLHSLSLFLFSEKIVELLRQFSGRSKQEGKNW
jgi:hypothetical protein